MATELRRTIESDGQMSFACFELRGRCFGLDVACVREIVRWQRITPLPKAPPLIEGVVELRGGIVPVLDLGRLMGEDPVQPGPDARIALLEIDGMSIGLCVEAMSDVMSVHRTSIEDVPELATQAGYDTVRAVVRRADADPVMVLSLEQIIESVYRSALPQAGPA